jgi:hypothetical protein
MQPIKTYPETFVECPVCDHPIAVDLSATAVACADCQVTMDLAPDASSHDRPARSLVAAA